MKAMAIDRHRKVTEVGGRHPLRYLQDGCGYGYAEEYLGRYNEQGEPVEVIEPEPEPMSDIAYETPTGTLVESTSPFRGMSLKELKDAAKDAGIKGASQMNKPDLIAILEY